MRFLCVSLVSVWIAVIGGCRSPEPTGDAPQIVRAALDHPEFQWESWTSRHFQLHANSGSFTADRFDAAAEAAEQARADVLARLVEQDSSERAQLFFVERRDQMRMLVGQPAAGWAVPEANAVFFVHGPDASPPLRHELGHLLSYRLWGDPQAYWLSEGVGVFVVGGCAGHDLHAWAASLERDGELTPMRELEREFDFSRAQSHLQAGSFVQYVAETYGTEAVKVLWREGLAGGENATGLSAEELEAAWRRHLQRPDFQRELIVDEMVACE